MGGYGLIGRSLSHSFSPAIHGMIGDYDYRLYPLEPDELDKFIRTTDLLGFNVTIPYKKDVIKHCRTLSPAARAVGSVNTMLRRADGWHGDNTDYDGFLHLLGRDAPSLAGKKALVLGSGGASATICTALFNLGVTPVVISRSGENNYDNLSKHIDAELIVNTTPVGMYPNNGASPIDLTLFPSCRLVLDLIYNPSKTALILAAEALGIKARGGLSMLAAQAIRAGELFLGKSLPPSLVGEITDTIRRSTLNIALIGMPGCGKTTVAAELAKLIGRPVADTDALIAERAGMEIPEIFEKLGEKHFRELETKALCEVSKESGLIIATGGGVVTIPENQNLIRQNSVAIFIERDIGELCIEGRPLSKKLGLKALHELRLPLYRAWADHTITAPDPKSAAIKIKEVLKL